MSEYSAKVVGMHFREKEGVPAKAIVGNMVGGEVLTLEREPDNRFDAYAIKVFFQGQHIGYIEASEAAYIAPDIDDGVEFTCTVVELESARNNLYPVVTIAPAD